MDSLLSAVILLSVVLHTVLFVYVQARSRQVRAGRLWLSLTILFSLLAALMFFIPEGMQIAEKSGRGLGLALTLSAMLVMFGALLIADVRRSPSGRLLQSWLGLGILWLAALIGGAFASEAILIGESDWIIRAFTTPNPFSWALIGGLTVTSLLLLGIAFQAFYAAPLPEVANRALYWVIVIAVILLGITLMVSGSPTLVLLGVVTLLIGIVGALYAQTSYRVFDIRSSMNLALKTALLVILTAIIVFGALQFMTVYIINRGADLSGTEGNLIVALVALIVAVIYVPIRRIAEAIINPILKGRFTDPTTATRRFSQQVSKAVELDQLIRIGTETLNDVLKVRRSGLLLVSDTSSDDGAVELLIMGGGGLSDAREKRGHLAKSSPIYQQLAAGQAPLSQFDMEFSPKYKNVTPEERQFFNGLNMSAFAPVIVENALIGILTCGAKVNDAPFYPRDLELLSTLANQTGVALRNARLVADLRHLNNSMGRLNVGLEDANKQMEKLDSVKTDFVTIASHELRTPLAQVRGYTDIIDALNEQGMLDQDQIKGMVANLRKATERMEELISAMLDVSQLDVNAMDLRFAQTTPEAVVRLAIEPLTDAIKQRKLTLSARGLRGLPPIEADMQRLVQAFRNVVVNAIKFTPDGGRIEITASLQAADQPNERDHILIAISDTGVGIGKENLELIFEKFFRAYDPGLHSTGTYKFMGAGPGLGLTIARGVIEGHGGKIWAESNGHSMESNPGTTFFILLPVSPPEDAKRVLPFESGQGEKVV
ncbi:MAG: GAF domain-containing protein [Anaerolineae bacterium]|nr:GAF domain-containing protein [Anaerolineae bacterium]